MPLHIGHGQPAEFTRGVVTRFRRTSHSAVSSSSTPIGVVQVSAPVVQGRLYEVRAPLLMCAVAAAATANALLVATIRATMDGSTPTAASPLVAQGHTLIPNGMNAATPIAGTLSAFVAPTTTAVLTCALSMYRGFGNQGVYLLSLEGYFTELVIEDRGVDTGMQGVAL